MSAKSLLRLSFSLLKNVFLFSYNLIEQLPGFLSSKNQVIFTCLAWFWIDFPFKPFSSLMKYGLLSLYLLNSDPFQKCFLNSRHCATAWEETKWLRCRFSLLQRALACHSLEILVKAVACGVTTMKGKLFTGTWTVSGSSNATGFKHGSSIMMW